MSNKIESVSIYDFGKICRTCLEEGDLKLLYDSCSTEVCLIEKLMSCTLVQFRENDGLPVQICLNCIKQINEVYTFAKRCESADIILRKCITQFQNKLRTKTNNENTHKKLNKLHTRKHCTSESELKVIEHFETSKIENDPSTIIKDQNTLEYNENHEHFDNIEELPTTNNDFIKEEPQLQIKSEVSDVEDSIPLKKRINNFYKHKTNSIYECKKCFEKFPNFQLLKLHREEQQHPRNSYNRKICKICNKSVGYSRMNQHMRTHTLEKPYCCEVCGARFSISSNLRRHTLSRHSNDKPYKCDSCSKGFTRLGLLKDHQRIHTGEKPFVCNYCGKSFARSAAFRTHLFIHAKSGETSDQISANDHQCTECQRCFATKALLKAHMLIHGEKKFLCSDCGRGFVSMILLKSHSKVHTGVRPYACQTCGKTFSHIGSLKSHNLIHTGQKPFACSVCNRAFTQRNHLKYHMRTHSGERPYICSVCGKTFALNGNLTVHMRTHTGETPFLCPICGKGFHDSSSMKKHKKGHTLINMNTISTT